MTSEAIQARLDSVLATPATTIREAIEQLDRAGTGVLMLSEDGQRLYGLLTDGDIRRSILASVSFDQPCGSIATRQPILASAEMGPAEMLRLMNDSDINQLPVVDAAGLVRGLVLRRDLVKEEDLGVSAVIMAGGYGKRLMPLTADTPKPMLPVGDRPLLERTIERLREAGIRNVNLTTHHLAERISGHFGDGHDFGVSIRYVPEDRPLGTAGGLRLMEDATEPVLVINGDILTGIDFRDLIAYHRKQKAEMTVCVRKYDFQVPYGVIECDGSAVRGVREKPEVGFLVNAGIYLLEPGVQTLIPDGERFDMTDLIQKLIDVKRRVVSYPIVEYWLDVGQPSDYEKAQNDVGRATRR